jgi:TatD DNase family protein
MLNMYIDLHCHLDHYLFQKDINQVIANARSAGLKKMVVSGISPASNRFALLMAKQHIGLVKASIGLYPIDALEKELQNMPHHKGVMSFSIDDELDFIKSNAKRICALGEIGLDYKDGEQKDEQKHVFGRLLELAHKMKKPVIIHSRKAEADVLDILSSHKLKVVLHCFSGDKRLVRKAADAGYNFTIPTHVVRSQQFQDMAKDIPLSQLFCETDSPYLSPFPNRRNEPAFVVESYKKIAELKGMQTEEVAKATWMNWQRVFE